MRVKRMVASAVACCFVAVACAAPEATTRPAESFKLTKRPRDVDAYGTSAYSFRHNSQDAAVHKNYVDVLYNDCRLLHLNPVVGMKSRATDLGEATLAAAPAEARPDARWYAQSFRPEAGHVYLIELNVDDTQSVVKLRVDEKKDETLTLSWTPVRMAEIEPPAAGAGARGAAGLMGHCGGADRPK